MQRRGQEGVCWRRQPSPSTRTPATSLALCKVRERESRVGCGELSEERRCGEGGK
jgi:hypothetical protein